MLFNGDKITVSVSHQVKIGREESWIRYEASSAVQPDESTEDAKDRVVGHVNRGVMDAVMQVVETVQNR